MEFLKSLLGSAAADLSNVIVYVIIVAVFIVGLICCVQPVVETRGKLRRAIKKLKEDGKTKRSWEDDYFLGKGALLEHWSAYLNNFFFAEDGVFHNPSDVKDFINEETVIYGPGRSAFAEAVPNLLVSLGFLGTLIGLSTGLAGFNMSDSTAAQNSIMTLIPGMKYAFMTSIFGVVGSVLFTLITRAIYGSTEHTLKSFYGAMSRYAGIVSVDPLTQVAIYQQEQNDILLTMAKDLNGSFTRNIETAIQTAVEPIQQNLKNFMTVTGKEQMRFLDAVVMRFVDRMDESLGGKMKDFGEMLDRTTKGQEAAFEAIRNGMLDSEKAVHELRNVQSISQQLVNTMSEYMQNLRGYQQQSEDAFTRISNSVEQMDMVSRQQTNYLKTVSAMQTEVTRSIETMTGAVNAFTKKFAEENAAASQAMTAAAADLRDASDFIANTQKSAMKSLDQEFKDTMDAYREYVNQFTQRVDYLAASISDSLSTLPNAVNETSDQFLDQMDRLSQTIEQAQGALNEAIDRMYAH